MADVEALFPLGSRVRRKGIIDCEGIVVGHCGTSVLMALSLDENLGWRPKQGDARITGIAPRFASGSFLDTHRFWWAASCNLQRVDEPVCGETQQEENYYDTHYRNCVLEPIKVMEKLFTPEEFKGFLKGCILKYRLRLGNKIGEDLDKELAKIQRYEQWLKEAEEGKEITV
ncbi:DUF3310 domain-containing protein [Megasphaera sp. SW808]|uniref:DUF3310 domain-containing protein n=1 Tax=Megasphaera sp. SW808 TaxID=2530045 RepID=UPI001439EFCF|nr:DUF3310 domain-containing protein [Megasphaera sp. SW808]NJE34595.1 DUF3310 domain-containing protein [Megasphaera sp. SW808]